MEQPTTPEPIITGNQAEERPQQSKPQNPKVRNIGQFWYVFVIIALSGVIAFGGFWIVTQDMLKPEPTPTPAPAEEEVDQDTQKLEEQGTSDETSEIEKDLLETDLESLDKELNEIENELNTP